VTPETAEELLAGEDIDGFLVGGASLDAQRLVSIVRARA
jgi:triosephosphate isomerase